MPEVKNLNTHLKHYCWMMGRASGL